MFRVDLSLSREAERFYAASPLQTARRLVRCFNALKSDPREGNRLRALKGSLGGAFRYRVGSLRVVNTIDDLDDLRVVILVVTIMKRADMHD